MLVCKVPTSKSKFSVLLFSLTIGTVCLTRKCLGFFAWKMSRLHLYEYTLCSKKTVLFLFLQYLWFLLTDFNIFLPVQSEIIIACDIKDMFTSAMCRCTVQIRSCEVRSFKSIVNPFAVTVWDSCSVACSNAVYFLCKICNKCWYLLHKILSGSAATQLRWGKRLSISGCNGEKLLKSVNRNQVYCGTDFFWSTVYTVTVLVLNVGRAGLLAY